MNACQRRVRQLHLRLDRGRVQLLIDYRLHPLADLRVVAVARYEDESGVEAAERVTAQEYAHALALVQVHDTAHGANQLGHARLEQLVARIGLQHVHDGFAVVTRRIEAEVSDDAVDLVPEQRNLARAAVVDGGGEQTEEAFFAGDAPAAVEGLHADVVVIRRAMDRRHRIRFGRRQQLRLARTFAQLTRQHGGLNGRAAPRAQDAETCVRQWLQHVFGAAATQTVLTIAEEGEVVVGHPLQQRLHFVHFGGAGRRRLTRNLLCNFDGALTHRAPVGDCSLHVGERSQDLLLQLAPLFIVDAVDLDVLPGFATELPVGPVALGELDEVSATIAAHGQHGVHHQVDREAGLRQHHAERVDQERHVLDSHFEDRVPRSPTVACFLGVVDAHQRLGRLAYRAEAQVRQCGGGQLFAAIFGQILLGDAVVVLADEVVCRQRIGALAQALRARGDALDQLLAGSRNGDGHSGRGL